MENNNKKEPNEYEYFSFGEKWLPIYKMDCYTIHDFKAKHPTTPVRIATKKLDKTTWIAIEFFRSKGVICNLETHVNDFVSGYNCVSTPPLSSNQSVEEAAKNFGKNNHLHNCPFCNGAEKDSIVLLGYKYPKFRVTCTLCGVMVEDDRIDKVQANWNMRNGISWMEQTPEQKLNFGAHWKEQQSRWVSKEELERRLSIAAKFSIGILCVELLKIPAELLVKYKIRYADELGESIDRVHSPDYVLPTPPKQ